MYKLKLNILLQVKCLELKTLFAAAEISFLWVEWNLATQI